MVWLLHLHVCEEPWSFATGLHRFVVFFFSFLMQWTQWRSDYGILGTKMNGSECCDKRRPLHVRLKCVFFLLFFLPYLQILIHDRKWQIVAFFSPRLYTRTWWMQENSMNIAYFWSGTLCSEHTLHHPLVLNICAFTQSSPSRGSSAMHKFIPVQVMSFS